MINSYVKNEVPFDLQKYLPVENDINIDDNGRLGITIGVPLNVLKEYKDEWLQHEWVDMYRKLSYEVARRAIGRNDWLLVRYYPYIVRKDDPRTISALIELTLVCDIFVAPHKDVVIPEFRYEIIDNKPKAIEWRCGYCNSPNKVEDRHCTQCGSARALLIQEMT